MASEPGRRKRSPNGGKNAALMAFLGYLLFGFLWMALFGLLLPSRVYESPLLAFLQNYHGWLFLALSGAWVYGLVLFNLRARRKDDALLKIWQRVAGKVGDVYFTDLTAQLCRVLQIRYACIARFDANGDPRFRMLVASDDGQTRGGSERLLPETLCDEVIQAGFFCRTRGAGDLFPMGRNFSPMGIEGLCAIRLADSRERPLGILAVIDTNPLPDRRLAESVLRGVAPRAGAELERLGADELIARIAYFDSRTGLPNRRKFKELLENALIEAKRVGEELEVIYLDFDRFKTIVRTLGHAAGEVLSKTIAQRLKGCLGPEEVLAQIGNDEFALLAPRIESPEQAEGLASRLFEAIRPPFRFQRHELHLAASMGIALFPFDGSDAETLLKNADAAMTRCKEMGGNHYQFYFPEMSDYLLSSLILENRLHKALAREEFDLYFQPQLNLATGGIDGMEALVFWKHPGGKPVGASDFIPLAEETGLIDPIGAWVLRKACEHAASWQEDGLSPQKVAVNVSARQFFQRNIVEMVAQALAETGLEPRWLSLEITESVFMQDVEQAIGILHQLRRMGVGLIIDDFGTGYSSLSYLRQFPIDTVKIDRSFVVGIPGQTEDNAITAAIIAMAHALGLEVVAEGVEREEQRDFLVSRGCDKIQGFLFSAPLTAAEFSALLRGH